LREEVSSPAAANKKNCRLPLPTSAGAFPPRNAPPRAAPPSHHATRRCLDEYSVTLVQSAWRAPFLKVSSPRLSLLGADIVTARRFAALCLSLFAWVVLIPASALYAQETSARISGLVTDQQKAVIRNAKIDLINLDTGVHYPTTSNNDGVYVVSAPVGNYRLQVDHAGFKTVIAANIVLHTQDAREINFELAVGSASESVTVNANSTNDSPAVSMTVDREFVENMPLNGRSFQDLIQLAPGAVSSLSGNGAGYYSFDGQRQDSNNFTVDGVSANLGGINNTAGVGSSEAGLSGSVPAQTVLGTTQSLASIDSLQEFTIQTSGYAAEFGRNPGGQVQFTTRSGTNELHGTLFDYFRNTALDANSYSNNYYDIPQTAEHQNDFGGTAGGPLTIPRLYDGKGKTFYFLSYEGLRLLLPSFESEYVPTEAFRQWASPYVQPFLNVVPLPSPNSPGNQDGCTVPNTTSACDALFNYGYSYPNNLDNYSIRVDQNLGDRFHAFARYAYTPSSTLTGAEETDLATVNVRSLTAGLTDTISTDRINEVRFNYSTDVENSISGMRSIGGSMPLPRGLVIPTAYDGPYSSTQTLVEVPGTSLFVTSSYYGVGSRASQYNLLDTFAWTKGAHSFKFGVDWRHFKSNFTAQPYESQIGTTSLTDIQQGNASYLVTLATAPGVPVFNNLSLFSQDHWRIGKRLTLDLGLRWELDPPPGPSNGEYPAVLTSNNLATATLAPLGTEPYQTRYDKFAPRIGFAWNAVPSTGHPLTLRGGFGIFYDTGQQTIAAAYAGGYPFAATGSTSFEVPLPLSSAELAPPSLSIPIAPPYPTLSELTARNLTLPYTEQWNLSLDVALHSGNTLTTSYVGNEGKKLLFSPYYSFIPGNPDFSNGLYFTDNGAFSNYNALQIQDRGRISSGLDIVASFTWAHALDNVSNDFSGTIPLYGNSDNDLRRVFNLALNYQSPTVGSSKLTRALTRGWVLANRFAAQSGNPLNVIQRNIALPNGTGERVLPNLVPGVPIYLHGSAADIDGVPVPGDWRLNRAAFAPVPIDPTTGLPTELGNLGRNYVRSPGFWAWNTSIQRSFPIHEELHLIFRVDAFNILNHPNLNLISSFLPASNFGYSNAGIGTIGASNQLYAMGAARSLQLSLKLQF
jgi:hypothetical protein